jgi:aminoglycoside phosphotransferase (APT) family kinase protein
MDIDRARQLIRELSPLSADNVELLGAGTDSEAFRVDGEWVVRFPLVPEAQGTLSTEHALLSQLAPQLPVSVPCPEHVAERGGQVVFSAYRALAGEPLSDAALSALSPSARARALDELAALLDAIHRFPVERARAAGVSFELCKGAYHPAQDNLERELSGMLDPTERACIARQRRAFESVQPRPFTPVLLHSDIKPAHLLHDPSSGALTGLLDWGDVSLGLGDFDLAIIGAFCGSQTLHGLLDRLDDADVERASASIPFLLTVRWLQDAVFIIGRGGEPCLCRLQTHLGSARRLAGETDAVQSRHKPAP